MSASKAPTDAVKEIAYLPVALKAPRIIEAAARLADYLAGALERDVSARNASGAQLRTIAAGFVARKTIEDFGWTRNPRPDNKSQRWPRAGSSPKLATWSSSDHPGPGNPTSPPAPAAASSRPGTGTGCCSPPTTDWVTRHADTHQHGRLPAELARLLRYGLFIVDEVGYLRSNKTPRTCSSNSSRLDTNTHR